MFCQSCGSNLTAGVKFCEKCGAKVEAPVQEPSQSAGSGYAASPYAPSETPSPYAPPAETAPVYSPLPVAGNVYPPPPPPPPQHSFVAAPPPLPEDPQRQPLGVGAFMGYMLLFNIPFVGFIALLVCAFSNGNINRKNYARAILMFLLIAIGLSLVFTLIGFLIALAGGVSFAAWLNDFLYW